MVKEIKGYDRKYFVSDEGIVYKYNMKAMHPHVNSKTGYCHLHLWKNGKPQTTYVHRLVAEAFVENKYGKNVVNHLDYDKRNNRDYNTAITAIKRRNKDANFFIYVNSY